MSATSLHLTSEPHHDADTELPAPGWLVENVPGTAELLEQFGDAKAAAKAAMTAHHTAVTAYRDASRIDRDGDRIARVDVPFDEWRALRANAQESERAEHASRRPVQSAWRALRDHIVSHPDAIALAESTAKDRHAELLDTLGEFERKLTGFAEAETLVPKLFARSDGMFIRRLAPELERLARDVRKVVTPPAPKWRRVEGTTVATGTVGGKR